MTHTVANRDVVHAARNRAFLKPVNGYGAFSFNEFPCGAGQLPRKLRELYQRRSEFFGDGYKLGGVFYSYSTPIAWFDKEFQVWVKPHVSYSITTSHHQSHLWGLSQSAPVIHIPADCGYEEYIRYASQKMIYAPHAVKGGCTIPGPNYIDGE